MKSIFYKDDYDANTSIKKIYQFHIKESSSCFKQNVQKIILFPKCLEH